MFGRKELYLIHYNTLTKIMSLTNNTKNAIGIMTFASCQPFWVNRASCASTASRAISSVDL